MLARADRRGSRVSAAALLTGVVWMADGGADRKEDSVRPLTTAELDASVGGVVDITWPTGSPWGQSYDNLQFEANVDNSELDTTSLFVTVSADGTKVGQQTVSTPSPGYTGTFRQRTRWPLNGQYDAQFHYEYNGNTFEADGDSFLANQYLLSNIHVYFVRFWNLNAGSKSTSVGSAFNASRVDDTNPVIPNYASNTADGVYGDCGGDKTQWRIGSTQNATISSSCSDLYALAEAQCPAGWCADQNHANCPAVADCLADYAAYADTFYDDVSVFHVYSLFCGVSGRSVIYNSGNPNDPRTFVLIPAGAAASATNYTSVLAHELAHDYASGHCGEQPYAQVKCYASDCTQAGQLKNLMCQMSGGRKLRSGQCTLIRDDFHWIDRN